MAEKLPLTNLKVVKLIGFPLTSELVIQKISRQDYNEMPEPRPPYLYVIEETPEGE